MMLGMLGSGELALANAGLRPDEGIVIQMNPQPGPIPSGSTVQLTGQMFWQKIQPRNHTVAPPPHALKQIEVHAFFPDYTQEVTSDVQIDPTTLKFSYSTPAIQASAQNLFIVQVGQFSNEALALQVIKSKLDQQIASLQKTYDHLRALGLSEKSLFAIQLVIQTTQNTSNRIQEQILSQYQVTAMTQYPLQVDNEAAQPSLLQTTIAGYQLQVTAAPGAPIEGTKTNITAKITNIRNQMKDVVWRAFDLPYTGYQADYFWNGTALGEAQPIQLDEGASTTFSYTSDGVLSQSPGFKLTFDRTKRKSTQNLADFTLTLPLSIDEVAPTWSNVSPSGTQPDSQTLSPIQATLTDSFGRIDPASIQVSITGKTVAGEDFQNDLTPTLTLSPQSDGSVEQISHEAPAMPEGTFRFQASGSDLAGNAAETEWYDFVIDRTAPLINVMAQDHVYLNHPQLDVPVVIQELNPVHTQVLLNGQLVKESDDKNFSAEFTLVEGRNTIEIKAVDAAGNASVPYVLSDINYDPVPPVLSQSMPTSGQILQALTVTASISSNEPLSALTLNGISVPLSAGSTQGMLDYTFPAEGNYTMTWAATDLAGNTSTLEVPVQVSLKLIRAELVSVIPDPEQEDHLLVIGAMGAALPGIQIDGSGGFFNSASTTAAQDGSFQLSLRYFETATLTGRDAQSGREESVSVGYAAITKLSGTVKDTDGRPLAHAKVSLQGLDQSTFTDGSGVFLFTNSASGNQTLLVDGSTVQDPCQDCAPRTFTTAAVKISIGLKQDNVMQRPVFMTPYYQDGTEVTVNPSEETSVTNPRAPGAELVIPADALPETSEPVKITMEYTPAEATTLLPPDFAKPDQVLSLEPSGLQFTKPVQVTLPNRDELPVGANVAIMSYNSKDGAWELDGVGKVDADGETITTKEGMGIRHFSQIYAVPAGMRVAPLGSQDKPGANTFDGSLTTQVQLPSTKIMGTDFAPSLTFKSAWSKPNVVVSNVFDIPRDELVQHVNSDGKVLYDWQKGDAWIDVHAWTTIQKVTSQFYTKGLNSGDLTFTGVPNQSVISYGFDLKDFDSGYYPYQSHWQVQLKRSVIATVKYLTRPWLFFGPMKENVGQTSDLSFTKVFPQDVAGQLYLQNKIHSEYGRGWKLAGPQRIIDPSANRLMIEESDGKVSTYAVENTITTALNLNSTSYRLDYGAKIQWPYLVTSLTNPNAYNTYTPTRFDLSLGANSLGSAYPMAHAVAPMNGILVHNWTHTYACGIFNSSTCTTPRHIDHHFSIAQVISDYLLADPDTVYGLSSRGDSFLMPNSGNLSPAIGRYQTPYTSQGGRENPSGATNNIINYLRSLGASVSTATYDGWSSSSGLLPVPGTGGSTFASGRLNAPRGMAMNPDGKRVAIADYGNHRVILANIETSEVSIIAGNGKTLQKQDEVPATQSSLVSPNVVAYDSVGNLFIATEQGYVRMVDLQGVIHTIGGMPYNDPNAIYGEKTPALQTSLKNPSGLVVDAQKGVLYVADSGHNRIVAFDLTQGYGVGDADVVAGTGVAGPTGDQGSALDAQLNNPKALGLDADGSLLIADVGNNKIRKVVFQNTSQSYLTFKPTTPDQSQIVKNSDGTLVRVYRDGSRVAFDASGYELYRQDRQGRTTQFEYDALKRVIKQTLPTGQFYSYTYSANLLSQVTDPAGRSTYFFYNGNELTQVQFPDGSTQSFAYDDQGLMTQETNARGKTTQYAYNLYGRIAKVIRPDQSQILIEDAQSKTLANGFTNGNSGALQSLKSDAGTDAITDPNGSRTEFSRDLNGYVSTIKGSDGKVTKIDRDLEGRPLIVYRNFIENDPDRDDDNQYDSQVFFTYNAYGDLIKKEDTETGLSVSATYDAQGDLLTEVSPTGVTTTHTYDSDGLGLEVATSDSVRGVFATQEYNDALKLKTKTTSASGEETAYSYDAAGNIASVTSLISGSQTAVSSNMRDAAGNTTASTNADGQSTHYEYDTWNRLTAVVTPKNERTEYSYSPTGKLLQVKDAQGATIQFTYDDLDQVVQKIDQLGTVNLYAYDANSNLTYEKDPNGNEKHYVYDSKNQLIRKTLPDDVYTYDYNSEGNLTLAKNNVSQIANAYAVDQKKVLSTRSRGLGALSNLPDVTLNYGYDAYGRLETMSDPSGTTTYAYDALSRMTGVSHPDGQAYAYGFDSGSRISSITSSGSGINPVVTQFGFDAQSFLTSIIHRKGGSSGDVIASLTYQRDLNGNRTGIQHSSGVNRTLAYDDDQQLTGVTFGTGGTSTEANESFTYDSIFNRATDDGGSYTYDSKKQRLTEDYRYFYFYDENGNLIKKQEKGDLNKVTSYAYNSENQLIGFKMFDGSTSNPVKEVQYFYDALGRRIQKTIVDHSDSSKSLTRRYVYNGAEILMEYNGENDLLVHYDHSGLRTDDVQGFSVTSEGVSAGLAPSAGSYRYLKDALGSITEIVDADANLVQRYEYSAYGKILSIWNGAGADISSNPVVKTSYTFTGREHDDESGLYYYRARYYDPGTGRFLQKDPSPGKMETPITLINSYEYSGNMPFSRTDPTGRFFIAAAFAIIASFAADVAVTAAISGLVAGLFGGILEGAVIMANGGAFFDGFQNGFKNGFIQGAIQGGVAFLGGGLMTALSFGKYAGTAIGLGMGVYGAYKGIEEGGGLSAGLLGFVGGFVSGTLGSLAGATAWKVAGKSIDVSVKAITNRLFYEILNPQIPNWTDLVPGAETGTSCALVNTLCHSERR